NPQQPSIDGNTVEEQIENAEYMKNSIAFQASFNFLNSKFKGLTSAIKGE
ncbi:MAG: flagellar basal-body rod protein FlgB, partial [Kiritimatiellia bacterium]